MYIQFRRSSEEVCQEIIFPLLHHKHVIIIAGELNLIRVAAATMDDQVRSILPTKVLIALG